MQNAVTLGHREARVAYRAVYPYCVLVITTQGGGADMSSACVVLLALGVRTVQAEVRRAIALPCVRTTISPAVGRTAAANWGCRGHAPRPGLAGPSSITSVRAGRPG